MLTFLLRIYYAFIIKMLPFEVFRQKLGISFKGGIQRLRGPNFIQFRPPTPLEYGHFRYYIPFCHVTRQGLSYDLPCHPPLVHVAIE